MNDTGGGVTAIHDVPGDITRIGFHWMLFFPFCHSKGGFYLFFTRRIAEVTDFLCPGFADLRIFSSHGMPRRSRGFFVPNYRIIEFSSHGLSRRSRIFFVPIFFSLSRIIELSNIFHTECRGGHGFFLITRLVLGPTDRREVIFEFSNCFFTRIVAE